MTSVGSSDDHARQLADVLICADYRGHHSHGISRLSVYVEDIATCSCAAKGCSIFYLRSVF